MLIYQPASQHCIVPNPASRLACGMGAWASTFAVPRHSLSPDDEPGPPSTAPMLSETAAGGGTNGSFLRVKRDLWYARSNAVEPDVTASRLGAAIRPPIPGTDGLGCVAAQKPLSSSTPD
ncbi:hypothetical protein LZ31DRAFT_51172 [Colletotrichum somersetense]|nr:hypothetical protein LZ31DRAFT_51172 [Colletotrichum somersetense]